MGFFSVVSRSLLTSTRSKRLSPLKTTISSSWERWISHNSGTADEKPRCEILRSSESAGYHVNGGPSFMRGAVFWGQPNTPLTVEEFHMPCPKAGEILIKTKACGICHSDLHVMKGELPFASPCVVGHEITGEVVDHGSLTDPGIVKRSGFRLKCLT